MLRPMLDLTVLKRLLRVVVFNMPFKNKFVQVIIGDRTNGWMPGEEDISGVSKALAEMSARDKKNFGDTQFLVTHDLIKFRPMSIDKLRKKLMFVVVGDENTRVDDVEFKKIELEVKAAFESAKLSTTRVMVLRHPVQLVEGDMPEEKEDVKTREPGVDTTAP